MPRQRRPTRFAMNKPVLKCQWAREDTCNKYVGVFDDMHIPEDNFERFYDVLRRFTRFDSRDKTQSAFAWVRRVIKVRKDFDSPRHGKFRWLLERHEPAMDRLTRELFKRFQRKIFGREQMIFEPAFCEQYHRDKQGVMQRLKPFFNEIWERMFLARYESRRPDDGMGQGGKVIRAARKLTDASGIEEQGTEAAADRSTEKEPGVTLEPVDGDGGVLEGDEESMSGRDTASEDEETQLEGGSGETTLPIRTR